MQCTKCGSEKLKKLSLVYEEGLSQVNLSSETVASGPGGVATGTTTSEGVSQTALSSRASPPQYESTIKLFFMHIVGFCFFGMVLSITLGIGGTWLMGLFSLAYIGLALFHLLQNFKFNRDEFPAMLHAWNNSFMCQQCGHVFEP